MADAAANCGLIFVLAHIQSLLTACVCVWGILSLATAANVIFTANVAQLQLDIRILFRNIHTHLAFLDQLR
jgi:hypothetical protein